VLQPKPQLHTAILYTKGREINTPITQNSSSDYNCAKQKLPADLFLRLDYSARRSICGVYPPRMCVCATLNPRLSEPPPICKRRMYARANTNGYVYALSSRRAIVLRIQQSIFHYITRMQSIHCGLCFGGNLTYSHTTHAEWV
jgi:hypothetical protein